MPLFLLPIAVALADERTLLRRNDDPDDWKLTDTILYQDRDRACVVQWERNPQRTFTLIDTENGRDPFRMTFVDGPRGKRFVEVGAPLETGESVADTLTLWCNRSNMAVWRILAGGTWAADPDPDEKMPFDALYIWQNTASDPSQNQKHFARSQRRNELRYFSTDNDAVGDFQQNIAIARVESAAYVGLSVPDSQRPAADGPSIVDLHAHIFSDLGFGRRVIVSNALRCDGEHHGLRWGITSAIPDVAPEAMNDPLIAGLLRHCPASDLPNFQSWTHEQYDMDDLREAHAQGLQVVVMSAVNTSVLCAMARGRTPDVFGLADCADDVNIHRQIAATWAYSNRDPRDFFQVVTTPEEAAAAIEAGKLAVLIGIEGEDYLDSTQYGGIVERKLLRRCERSGDPENAYCTAAAARVERQLYNLGVTVVIPTHEWDNAVGGASTHLSPLFQPAYQIRNGPRGTPDVLGALPLGARFALFRGKYRRGRIEDWPMPREETVDASDQRPYFRSTIGLSAYGQALTAEMADGMLASDRETNPWVEGDPASVIAYRPILDLTHANDRVLFDLQHMAREGDVPPVVISHGVPRALSVRDSSELEFPNSDERILFVVQQGGMLAVQTSNDSLLSHEGQSLVCPGSVESIQNGLAYLGAFYPPGADFSLAYGSDLNGAAFGTAPEAGPNACLATNATPAQMRLGQIHQCLVPPAKPLEGYREDDRQFQNQGLSSIRLLPALDRATTEPGGTIEPEESRTRDGADYFLQVWSGTSAKLVGAQPPGPPSLGNRMIYSIPGVDLATARRCGLEPAEETLRTLDPTRKVDVALVRDGSDIRWTLTQEAPLGNDVVVLGKGNVQQSYDVFAGVSVPLDASGAVAPLSLQDRRRLRLALRQDRKDTCAEEEAHH